MKLTLNPVKLALNLFQLYGLMLGSPNLHMSHATIKGAPEFYDNLTCDC